MITGFSKVTERKITAKLDYIHIQLLEIYFLELIKTKILCKYIVSNNKYF